MSERYRRVRTYRVTYQCDDEACRGEMQWTGTTRTTYPPLYEHRCSTCGTVVMLDKSYPYLNYEEQSC